MPYNTLSQLPESVRNNLPKHAQEIYKSAFNSAWDTYKRRSDRADDDDRETVSHKVAWAAVKKSYAKASDGRWVQRQ